MQFPSLSSCYVWMVLIFASYVINDSGKNRTFTSCQRTLLLSYYSFLRDNYFLRSGMWNSSILSTIASFPDRSESPCDLSGSKELCIPPAPLLKEKKLSYTLWLMVLHSHYSLCASGLLMLAHNQDESSPLPTSVTCVLIQLLDSAKYLNYWFPVNHENKTVYKSARSKAVWLEEAFWLLKT